MKKQALILTIFGTFLVLTSFASAQSISIDSINPSSITKTKGESFSVDVTYTIQSVSGSCQLRVSESSLPSGWGVSNNPKSIDCSSRTSSIPTITANTEDSGNIRVYVESDSSSTSAQDTFYADVSGGSMLNAELLSSSSIDVKKDQSYKIRLNVKNSGNSNTDGAYASVGCPSGYSGACGSTHTLTEVGQSSGVITAGNTVYKSFTIDTADPTSGDLTIEVGASNSPEADSVSVSLSAPTPPGGEEEPTGGGPGGPIVPALPSQAKSWANVTPGVVKQMEINKTEELGVKQIRLAVRNKANDVKITVRKQEGRPSDVSVNVSGKSYRYLNIEAQNINESNTEEAKIQFQANKTWIQENNIDPSKVYLYRYTEEKWNRLNTSKVSESVNKVSYEARTPGFSYFAVSGEEKVEEEEGPDLEVCPTCPEPSEWSECVNGTKTRTNYRCSEETNYICESYQEERKCEVSEKPEGPDWKWVIISLVVIVLVISVYYFKFYNRKGRTSESSGYDYTG